MHSTNDKYSLSIVLDVSAQISDSGRPGPESRRPTSPRSTPDVALSPARPNACAASAVSAAAFKRPAGRLPSLQ